MHHNYSVISGRHAEIACGLQLWLQGSVQSAVAIER